MNTRMMKKISVIMAVLGAVMIFGVMGESDLKNLSFTESFLRVLSAGGVICISRAVYILAAAFEAGRARCTRIAFSKGRSINQKGGLKQKIA